MDNKPWTDLEIKDAIESYLTMLKAVENGERFVKSHIYKQLAEKHKRTPKAFEYRMQNVSYVMQLHGRDWVPGLLPKPHVGRAVVERIERILSEIEMRPLNFYLYIDGEVSKYLKQKSLAEPEGVFAPKRIRSTSIQIERDAKVKAWVLLNAKGVFEACSNPAPFNRIDGTPYLEVHHLKQLADGGRDTIDNAVALCPNCHRELHFGENKEQLEEELYQQIDRLKI